MYGYGEREEWGKEEKTKRTPLRVQCSEKKAGIIEPVQWKITIPQRVEGENKRYLKYIRAKRENNNTRCTVRAEAAEGGEESTVQGMQGKMINPQYTGREWVRGVISVQEKECKMDFLRVAQGKKNNASTTGEVNE